MGSNSDRLNTPITESVDIAYFLSEYFPGLCQIHLSEQTKQLLTELHDINYFSLTYTHNPQRASVKKLLSEPGISCGHREALKFKFEA